MSPRNDDGKSGKKAGPAWRGNRQGGGKVKAGPDWKTPKPQENNDAFKYKLKRTLLWLGCIALFITFVLFLIPPQNTPLVVFRASAYPLQFPPLALAKEDEDFFTTAAPSNLRVEPPAVFRFFDSADNQSNQDGTPQRFLEQLSKVSPSGPGWFSRNDTVIIHIAAHGLVNEKGQACLVPPNADAFDSGKWLPLSGFLKDICDLKNLKRARKLVVLDCNRISMKWRSGVMDNRFADQLPTVIKQVGDPDLYVLNSTSPGQVGWSAPELRGSVFGHFLGRGLRGDASLQYPNDRSRYVVTLVELRDYLAANVDHYVRERRGARQVPVVYCGPDGRELGVKDDVAIISSDWLLLWRTPDPPLAPYDVLAQAKNLMESSGQQQNSLTQAWEAYQRRAAAQTDDRTSELPVAWRRGFVMDPIRWAALEQRLLALEERLFAGEEYQVSLAKDFAKIAAELSAPDWQKFPETQSATNLRLTRWKHLAGAANRPAGDDKPANLSLLYDTWLQAAPEAQPRISFPDDDQPRAIRELLSRFGLDQPADPQTPFEKFNFDRLNSVLKFLRVPADAAPVAQEQFPVEAHVLKLLASSSSPAAEVLLPEALRTRSLAEQAATPLDVRAHYPIEWLVNQADAERRAGEDAYFLGDRTALAGTGGVSDASAERNSAEQRLQRAQGFSDPQLEEFWDGQHTGYLAARRWGDVVGEMYLLRDEIWATLPYLAEWYFRRWRLELAAQSGSDQTYQQHITTLTEVLDQNVEFSEQLERLLSKRDREQDLRDGLSGLAVKFTTLKKRWEELRLLASNDSKVRGKAENVFQQGDDVRRIEQVMHTPLYYGARVQDLLSKYHLTLVSWSEDIPEPPGKLSNSSANSAVASDLGAVPRATDESKFLDGYREFLNRYQQVLTHEFQKPYDKDLDVQQLLPEHQFAIDRELRRPAEKGQTIWKTLNGVLRDYDTALSKNPVAIGRTTRADQAREVLSIWDRRVRTSAYWLACFNRELIAPALGRPTPAAWLREVDHWHLTCWHGYRLLQDFLGNGLPNDSNRQFFDLAAEHTSLAAQAKDLPFQYDVPGAGVENLEDLHEARKLAHAAGVEVQIRSVQTSDPAPATGEEFKAATTQRIEVNRKAADMPAGFAGFYLSRAGVAQQLEDAVVEYQGSRAFHRARVELFEKLSNQPGPRAVTGKIQAANLKPPVALEARVWYRGHVWSQPFEVYHEVPKTGIKFVHRREPYSAPTVQVGGDDAPSGAVTFVFDMSASMATPDGRFDAAHAALRAIIKDLKTVPPGLKVGLIAYGHRTPNVDDFPLKGDRVFYDRTLYHDNFPRNLTKAGRDLGDRIKNFPHPDRDIQTLLVPDAGWAAGIDASLDSLKVDRCFGVTPLYAAITEAIKVTAAVPGVESRQVIVLSDGINMPYNCAPERGWIDAHQNDLDFKDLRTLLDKNNKVKVRVVLFGGLAAEPLARKKLELAQLAELESAGAATGFVVDVVPKLEGIKKSIKDAFAKPDFEVVAADRDRASLGRLPFGSIWTYPNWPAPGDLILPQPHQVIVRGPRLPTPLAVQLQLGGGEALRGEYQAANSTLEFLPDILDRFYSSPLEPRGNYTGPDMPVVIETVKPFVGPPSGDTRPTTFRLRMGSNASRRFIPWPRHVWAEITPLKPPAKYKDLNFQIADLKFEDKTRTPILHFPVPNWPIAVEGAQIEVWLRYGSPKQFQAINISPADQDLPTIAGQKYGLDGVEFRLQQQVVEGTTRKITVTEKHPVDTPLARLYRTRVQLSPPADFVERLYLPPSGTSSTSEVVHTFHYTTQVHLNANLSLDINTAEQIKDGSLRATVQIEGWNR